MTYQVTEQEIGLDATNILPSFSINRIFVFEKSLRVLCSLDRENNATESWLGSSDFLKFINIKT